MQVGEERARIVLEAPDCGALAIRVKTETGLPAAGGLRGGHVHVAGQEADEFHFFEPPYFLPVLPEGDYELRVDGLRLVEPATHPVPFTILAGETTTLELTIQ